MPDYGMGGLWWWVRAASPAAIVGTIAEVQVVTDPKDDVRGRVGVARP